MSDIVGMRMRGFKGFRDFQFRLEKLNIFAGGNNAGKSTILDAFRALSGALRFARQRLPTSTRVINGRRMEGYTIPVSFIPITVRNVHHKYDTESPAQIEFNCANGNKLFIEFDHEDTCRLFIDTQGTRILSRQDFVREFPIEIAVVPTLGPFEESEALLTEEYVLASEKTRRAHRLFRNIWYFKEVDQFEEFAQFVAETWPGMQVRKPELSGHGRDLSLSMICREGDFATEVYWAGFGFQIWLQFLTHILGGDKAQMIVVDEPDIYLHPDLQRKLLALLRATGRQIVLATHSPEILSEAELDEIVFVDKRRATGRRLNDVEGLQSALEAMGSSYDVHLNRLAHGKRVIFFEGQDFKLYRRLAAKLGLVNLSAGLNFTAMPVGGISEHRKVEDAVWTFENVLKAEIRVAAIFDRDYMRPDQVEEFLKRMTSAIEHCYVLGRKEIENYLLDQEAVSDAVADRLDRSTLKLGTKTLKVSDYSKKALRRALASTKAEACSSYVASRVPASKAKLSNKTIVTEAMVEFEAAWRNPERRLALVPGKKALSALNRILQREARVSISAAQIIERMKKRSIPEDLRQTLETIDRFVSGSP